MVRDEVDQLAVEAINRAENALAQAHRALSDRVEDRLDVRRRAADHAQDLTGRRLLLQRLREVAVAGLEFREEAHVLDRDHGLVGEGPEQSDLLFGERPRLGPGYRNPDDG